jgi:hypothetical protein
MMPFTRISMGLMILYSVVRTYANRLECLSKDRMSTLGDITVTHLSVGLGIEGALTVAPLRTSNR